MPRFVKKQSPTGRRLWEKVIELTKENEALKREVVKTKHYVLVILHAITIADERDRQVLINSMHWLQDELEKGGHLDNCSCPMYKEFPFRTYQ